MNNTSRASTAIITPKFPWFALWAWPSRASRNISEENEHGGTKPTPFSAGDRQRIHGRSVPGRSIAFDEPGLYAAGAPQSQAPQKNRDSDRQPCGAGCRGVPVAPLEQL